MKRTRLRCVTRGNVQATGAWIIARGKDHALVTIGSKQKRVDVMLASKTTKRGTTTHALCLWCGAAEWSEFTLPEFAGWDFWAVDRWSRYGVNVALTRRGKA